ncbi:MAG: undecaprenyl phosphate translocase family protein, partial [Brevinema sp.]
MNTISLIIKGMIVGIANIIPGVSGGTMAFILGIYKELSEAIVPPETP